MSGSQFQQFNEDLNKMLGSTLTVSIIIIYFWGGGVSRDRTLVFVLLKQAVEPWS